MKTIEALISEIEAGKVVIPVTYPRRVCLFRNDQDKYVLSTPAGFYTAGSVQEILDVIRSEGANARHPYDDGYDAHDEFLQVAHSLLASPIWQVADTDLPEAFVKGKTLFSLRRELEEGKVVSPLLFTDERPYCIRKSEHFGFMQYTPFPWNDVTASYDSVDALFAHNFYAHFPIWQVGQSPAFRETEEEAQRQMQGEEPGSERKADDDPFQITEEYGRELDELMERLEVTETKERENTDDGTCYECGKAPAVTLSSGNTIFCSKECEEANSESVWPTTTAYKLTRLQFEEDVQRLRNVIMEVLPTYTGHYPDWQIADALCKKLAEIDWEKELHGVTFEYTLDRMFPSQDSMTDQASTDSDDPFSF
jgi:hypothetical protein